MTRKPTLLDAFCGEGGAAEGYSRLGFTITGVDHSPERLRHYPFRGLWGDAVAYIREHGHTYDAIHASPPCQAYSVTRFSHRTDHPDLIDETRDALTATGRPWIIENVIEAPLRNPVTLCGAYFGLTATDPSQPSPLVLRRHRIFESNIHLTGVPCCCRGYTSQGYTIAGVYGGGTSDNRPLGPRRGGYTPPKAVMADLIGAPWMTVEGLTQSIPPAYTQHLGRSLLQSLKMEQKGLRR